MVRAIGGGVLLVLVAGALATVLPSQAAAPTGAKWDYTVYDEDGKEVQKGAIVVRGFVLVNLKNKRIGTYEEAGPGHIKVDVDEGKLKGKMDLYRDKENTSAWKGELKREDGGKYKITFVFEKNK
jgi:hypothetical protein